MTYSLLSSGWCESKSRYFFGVCWFSGVAQCWDFHPPQSAQCDPKDSLLFCGSSWVKLMELSTELMCPLNHLLLEPGNEHSTSFLIFIFLLALLFADVRGMWWCQSPTWCGQMIHLSPHRQSAKNTQTHEDRPFCAFMSLFFFPFIISVWVSCSRPAPITLYKHNVMYSCSACIQFVCVFTTVLAHLHFHIQPFGSAVQA